MASPIKTFAILLSLLVTFWPVDQAESARIKDLASVKGVRNNQLVGYGLVVGLNGTGDGNNASFTTQALTNMLKNVGMPVNENDIKVKNVAGVMVTADLPPFIKSGQTIDVTISSLGDASSLQGGTLITTPLKGLDKKIYAIAQGAVSIGGFQSRGTQPEGSQANHRTVARIPNGATIEREVPVSFSAKNQIFLSLKSPDFTTVSRMVDEINNNKNNEEELKGARARGKDGATIVVDVPKEYQNNTIPFLAALERVQVKPDSTAKVVVDERTGTIVMGEEVRITNLALSHGSLTIQVSAESSPPIPTELIGKILTDEMVKKMIDSITGTQKTGTQPSRLVNLAPGTSLGEVVRALNSVGVAPRDLIAIFQAIKAAGALQAELKII